MAQRIFILGAGRFGTHLATRLSEFGSEVVLVDKDPLRVKDLAEDGFQSFEMDVDDEDALKELGVSNADVVVVCIGENMESSILATLALKELKVKKIVARALDSKHAQVLEKVGADIIVLPTRDMAYRLAERLRDNSVNDRLPISGEYQLAFIKLGMALHGKTLAEANLSAFNVSPILVLRPYGDETQELQPSPDVELACNNDILVLTGKREDINTFENEYGWKQ